jgi:hypothetical protein
MRTKSLTEPATAKIQKGDEWLSPDGHSPAFRRVWNGTAWVEDLKAAGFPATGLSPENPDLSDVGTEEDDDDMEETVDTEEEEQPSTEGTNDEHGMQAEVSDRDGGEQGAGGKPEPKPQQRGKRGKVRKGRQGK